MGLLRFGIKKTVECLTNPHIDLYPEPEPIKTLGQPGRAGYIIQNKTTTQSYMKLSINIFLIFLDF